MTGEEWLKLDFKDREHIAMHYRDCFNQNLDPTGVAFLSKATVRHVCHTCVIGEDIVKKLGMYPVRYSEWKRQHTLYLTTGEIPK